MANNITLTFAAFAHDLGAAHRITHDVSLVWHKQYASADSVTCRAMREEFILNFLQGYGLSATNSAKVMAQSRDDRSAEHQKVYDAARAKFTYHVVRPVKKDGSADQDVAVKLAAQFGKLGKADQRRFLKLIGQ